MSGDACGRLSLIFFIILSVLIPHIQASLVNYTIDDQDGDQVTGQIPQYSLSDWKEDGIFVGSGSALLPLQPFDNTWSLGNYLPFESGSSIAQVNITFTGTCNGPICRPL